MRSSLATTIPAGAAAVLMALGMVAPASATGGRFLVVSVCGDHGGSVRIPLDERTPGRDRDCPAACHAACAPRREADDGEA